MQADTITRRRLVQLAGAATGVALAGCADDDPADEEGMGERVPEPLVIEYWSDLGGNTQVKEAAGPIIQENLQETLDTDIELRPVEFTTQLANNLHDSRTHHISFWYHANVPDRLDPDEMTRRYAIDWAGGTGMDNPPNYASCEYSEPALEQRRVVDEERRRELVYEAQSILSEEYITLPLMPQLELSAANAGTVDVNGTGEAGLGATNPHSFIFSEPTDGDVMSVNIVDTYLRTTNYPVLDASPGVLFWTHLINSAFVGYDENYELQNILAESIESENDGERLIVELKDATFHNGDPVTSEDVKFSYEFLWEAGGAFPQVQRPDYTSIEIVDERTTEFNFEDPTPAVIAREWAKWGILHQDTWVEGGADGDPEEISLDEIVGCGPFEVEQLSLGDFIFLTPHDGHPVYEPDHEIEFEVFRDEVSAVETFVAGDLDAITNLSPGGAERIEDEMEADAEIVPSEGFLSYLLYPQYPYPPNTFEEFRQAVGMCMDRELMVEVALDGRGDPEMYSCPIRETHPYRPPDDMLTRMADDPSGDIEGARQVLEDAGWSWDDDDNLRYPEGADTSELWPAEELPRPEDFDCLDDDGEYVGTS